MKPNEDLKDIRILNEGYGVKGITMRFTMAHIYSMDNLRNRLKIQIDNTHVDTPTEEYDNAQDAYQILNFILRDIESPNDTSLWSIPESKCDNSL